MSFMSLVSTHCRRRDRREINARDRNSTFTYLNSTRYVCAQSDRTIRYHSPYLDRRDTSEKNCEQRSSPRRETWRRGGRREKKRNEDD